MAADETEEPREASGLTTRLVLAFVEEEGGHEAVDAVLARAGMSGREDELRDENRWFADRTRVRLFEAAAEVLDEPGVGRRIGERAIDLNVGQALKISLRALGSPRLIYSNVDRGNAKFNRVHRMDVLDLGSDHARIRNVPVGGAEWHPCDCDYNIGLLACAPQVFGEPPAHVRHPRCIGAGDDECVYEVEWSAGERARLSIALAAAALVALAVAAFAAPDALPVVAAVAAAVAAIVGTRALADRNRRWRLLRAQVSEQAEATDLLMASMQELVSALRTDEVLSRITANARAAVGGAEFALLVEEEGKLRCRSSSDLPATTIAALEAWADASADLPGTSTMVNDLATVPALEALPPDRSIPLGSLCAAPLVHRGEPIGTLVALAASHDGFLPRDAELLSSYAAQAAIAITNARLYEAQQELATRDPLTGLFNHRHFHETLARELERCRRHGGEVGLVMLDLDAFKQVNDTGGHAEGDEVLRRVASALERTCRRSDLAFRIGGDEFALVLPSSGKGATEIAAARAAGAIAAVDARTSVSYGVSSWPSAGPTKDALVTAADASLYGMKRSSEGPVAPPGPAPRGTAEHERLASASRMAVKLAPLVDAIEIAETAVRELDASFGYRRIVVHRIEGDGRILAIAAAGTGLDGLLDVPPAGEDGAVAGAARSSEAVQVDAAWPSGDSELATPIRVEGEPWGVIELVHDTPGAFDFDDVLFADTVAAAVGAAIHRSQLYAELEGTFMRTLAVLSDALEAKDSYTAAHAREVADLAERVGRALGMAPDQLRTLSYGALLHDIGKIAIRSEILHKPTRLTEDEYREMQEHTVIGARMLERIPYFAEVHPLVRSSHERWDGGGYPDGAQGEDIPLGARIISACDAFNAMTSDRPYRAAMDHDEAVAELRRHAASQFDPAVIAVLVDLLGPATEDGGAARPAESARAAL
jgi:diguanylate cyclase (GGDEF)-like protein/putative nucleotidyltransferase with HDIG domain